MLSPSAKSSSGSISSCVEDVDKLIIRYAKKINGASRQETATEEWRTKYAHAMAKAINEADKSAETPEIVSSKAEQLIDTGNWEDALVKYLKLRRLMRKVAKGSDTSDTADMYNQVGFAMERLAMLPLAQKFFEASVAIRLRLRNPQDSALGATYHSMASVYKKQKKMTEAMEFFRKAYSALVTAHGELHPDSVQIYNDLASLSLEHYGRAFSTKLEKLGKDHPEVAQANNQMALVLEDQGKYDEALVLYNKSLKIFKASLGKDHKETKATKGCIVRCTQSKQKAETATAPTGVGGFITGTRINVTKMGMYFEKESISSPGTWNKRWFQCEGSTLTYYHGAFTLFRPGVKFDLKTCKLLEAPPGHIYISSAERMFKLRSSEFANVQRWKNALKDVLGPPVK
jgi:tetratricopeptide (TPR) repeat protein